MNLPNAFLVFLISFSCIMGWLLLHESESTTNTDIQTKLPEKPVTSSPEKTATPSTKSSSEPKNPTVVKLETTILPVIDLDHVTLAEALDFLQIRSKDVNHTRNITSGSMIFTISPEVEKALHQGSKHISLYQENISLANALNLICEQVQCRWEIDRDQVIIVSE